MYLLFRKQVDGDFDVVTGTRYAHGGGVRIIIVQLLLIIVQLLSVIVQLLFVIVQLSSLV